MSYHIETPEEQIAFDRALESLTECGWGFGEDEEEISGNKLAFEIVWAASRKHNTNAALAARVAALEGALTDIIKATDLVDVAGAPYQVNRAHRIARAALTPPASAGATPPGARGTEGEICNALHPSLDERFAGMTCELKKGHARHHFACDGMYYWLD